MTEYAEQCLQRMEALVRRMATGNVAHTVSTEEARAIVAEIDGGKTVDRSCKELADKWIDDFVTPLPSARRTSLEAAIGEAIAKGRELERLDRGWKNGELVDAISIEAKTAAFRDIR
jgi:hypothetical protein